MEDIPPVRDTIMATDWRWWWSLWGKESLSSHQRCPDNWKNCLMGKSLSWSLKVHVMMYAKGKAVFNLLWKWLIFQLLLDQRWLTNFLLPSLIRKKEFLNLLQVYSVNLLMSYIPLVIGKVSYTSHRTWPPRHFHKERLEIVAKAESLGWRMDPLRWFLLVLLKENKRDLLRNFMNVVFLNIRWSFEALQIMEKSWKGGSVRQILPSYPQVNMNLECLVLQGCNLASLS